LTDAFSIIQIRNHFVLRVLKEIPRQLNIRLKNITQKYTFVKVM